MAKKNIRINFPLLSQIPYGSLPPSIASLINFFNTKFSGNLLHSSGLQPNQLQSVANRRAKYICSAENLGIV